MHVDQYRPCKVHFNYTSFESLLEMRFEEEKDMNEDSSDSFVFKATTMHEQLL